MWGCQIDLDPNLAKIASDGPADLLVEQVAHLELWVALQPLNAAERDIGDHHPVAGLKSRQTSPILGNNADLETGRFRFRPQ